MRYQKIIRRDDGSRVRINVEMASEWLSDKVNWSFSVDTCEKGKRTWLSPCDENSYSFRRLSTSDRERAIVEESLRRASSAEIEAAMVELWELIRPRLICPVWSVGDQGL